MSLSIEKNYLIIKIVLISFVFSLSTGCATDESSTIREQDKSKETELQRLLSKLQQDQALSETDLQALKEIVINLSRENTGKSNLDGKPFMQVEIPPRFEECTAFENEINELRNCVVQKMTALLTEAYDINIAKNENLV